MKNKDKLYSRDFLNDLTNKIFSSVKSAQMAARDLFKIHNSIEYKENQATVSSEIIDGKRQKVFHKKTDLANNLQEPGTQEVQFQQFIQRAKQKLRERANVDLITE